MTERESLQLRIGHEIEESALPYYRTPYPQSPRVPAGGGGYRVLENPFYGVFDGVRLDYDSYLAKVRDGSIAARPIHGSMHATRVALLTGLLAVFLERHTEERTAWLFEMQMAGAFHDAGRQDEGSDEWERDSQRIFEQWLRRTPGARIEALDMLDFHEQKRGHRAEGDILRDADILDIQRVLTARNRFDATRLSFWRDPRIRGDTKQSLIDETWSLIRLTERHGLKRRLEHSGALYFQLMRVIVELQREQSSCPLLFSLLQQLAGHEDTPDDDAGPHEPWAR
jgi:hypothetical protein